MVAATTPASSSPAFVRPQPSQDDPSASVLTGAEERPADALEPRADLRDEVSEGILNAATALSIERSVAKQVQAYEVGRAFEALFTSPVYKLAVARGLLATVP